MGKWSGGDSQTAVKDLLFACTAGCINVLLTNPLWVVNSRLKMAGIAKDVPTYRGTLDGLIKIALQEGIGSLWNGTKASLLLVSNPLQIVQAKARHGKISGIGMTNNPTMHMIAAKIIREQGAAGLFKGVDSKLLQSALAAG